MGPKKSKGKAIATQDTSGVQPEEELAPALIGTRYSTDVEKFRPIVADRHKEYGVTVLTPACFERHAAGLYPSFIQTFFAGLVLLFSLFME